jgi:hypothetical protein
MNHVDADELRAAELGLDEQGEASGGVGCFDGESRLAGAADPGQRDEAMLVEAFHQPTPRLEPIKRAADTATDQPGAALSSRTR